MLLNKESPSLAGGSSSVLRTLDYQEAGFDRRKNLAIQ